MKYDQSTNKVDYDASVIFDAQDLALKLLVEKIVNKDGKEIVEKEEIINTILGWRAGEADKVYDEIDKITSFNQLTPISKKK